MLPNIKTAKMAPWYSNQTHAINSNSKSLSQEELTPSEPQLNWQWYNPPAESLPVQFCSDTALHGLTYIGQQDRHIAERVFWLISFVISAVFAAVLISTMVKEYNNMPIVTVMNPTETRLDEIPFPSVTICNVNKIQKSRFEKLLSKTSSHYWKNKLEFNGTITEEYRRVMATFEDMKHICDSTFSFLDRFIQNGSLDEVTKETAGWKIESHKIGYNSPRETSRMLSQPCDEMILYCRWENENRNCSEIFQPIETDNGFCCTFNTLPMSQLLKHSDPIGPTTEAANHLTPSEIKKRYRNLLFTEDAKDRTYPLRQRSAGRTSGLSFLLYPDLDEYYCTNTDSVGLMMGINVPLDYPRMEGYSTAIPTDSEVFVGIRPDITMSDKSLRNFPKSKQNCYYINELDLPHYTLYTNGNCKSECLAKQVLEKCGCVYYYMAHAPNSTLCTAKDYTCADGVQKNISNVGLATMCEECLPTCNEVEYHKEVSTLRLQRRRLQTYFNRTMTDHKARGASIVHVYFNVDSVYPKLRKQMMTLTQLISNAGGLLGLCLGFSVLSLLEICYFGTFRIFCRWYRKKAIRDLEKNDIPDDVQIFRVVSRTSLALRFGYD